MDHGRDTEFYALVAALGVIAGLRSASAPATASALLARGAWPRADDPAVALAVRLGPALRAAALAELAADKLPMMPDRTAPPVLAGRVLLGSLSGGLLARAAGRSPLLAAALAGLLAVAGSFAGLRLRRLLSDGLGLPNLPAGLAEDALVLAAAGGLVARSGAPARQLAVAGR